MTTLNGNSKPAWSPTQDADVQGNVVGNVQGPMSQQAAVGSHGYDIHPQTFVRLVGCRQSDAAKYDAMRSRRRTAA